MLWPGNQTNQPWDGGHVEARKQPPNFHPDRRLSDGLRDAGFVYLVTGDTVYRDAVRQALLSQVALPGTDFTNLSKWVPHIAEPSDNINIVIWARKLVYGYSYIRSSLSLSDKATIDRWFLNVATFWAKSNHAAIATRFPRRYQDDYKTPHGPYTPGDSLGKAHADGPMVYKFHRPWLNKPAAANALVGAVGALLEEPTLKEYAKRFVKEWLMFCVAPDGSVCDQVRWNKDSDPQKGFAYAGTVIGSIVSTIDHLARAGDSELYDYETSFGYYGWAGGPKSLRLVLQRFAALTLGERQISGGLRVYAGQEASTEQTKYIIGPGENLVYDICLIPANLYYKNATIRRAYTRPLPQQPKSGGYDPWGGDWGTYPGVRFMFGQLEGVVWPYPHRQSAIPTDERRP
jgi:hypothetical protein